MRRIYNIVVHCTGTEKGTPSTFKRYWRDVLGWKNPGYHYLITKNGDIHRLTDEESIANGVRGFNKYAIHVAYVGGSAGVDNRTEAQKEGLEILLDELSSRYPNATICGHRDFPNVKKTCPNFDAIAEYSKF